MASIKVQSIFLKLNASVDEIVLFGFKDNGRRKRRRPCLTETWRPFITETKTACASESSSVNSSSLVTDVERVFRIA